jgi:hypothetical protein
MAGGYDNEDRQAGLEELRREKEREARERLEELRRQEESDKAKANKAGGPPAPTDRAATGERQ